MRRIVLMLFGSFAVVSAKGQFKNIRVAENVFEPAVTINRKVPGNIVAASAPGYRYYSTDGGLTWQKSESVAGGKETSNHALASDRKGELYNLFVSQTEEGKTLILCQISKDGGNTWLEYSSLQLPDGQTAKQPSVFLNTKSGEMLLVWTQFDSYGSDGPGDTSSIMLSRSKDGKKWSTPFQLSLQAGDCLDNSNTPRGATPVISMDNKMFVSWSMSGKLLLDRSFDKGSTWLNNDIGIDNQAGGWSLNIPGLKKGNGLPKLCIDNSPGRYNGSLFLVYADQRNGEHDTDIWFLRSVNFGDNWTTPLRVNDDGKGKHQFMPAMAVDQTTGHLYIVYYDRRAFDDEQTDVYLAYSIDNGNSFRNVKISETPFSPDEEIFPGEYLTIDAYRGTIVPVWTRIDDGKTSVWTAPVKHEDLVKASTTAN